MADGVNVGVGDECFVGVMVSVAVAVGVEEGVTVAGKFAVKVETAVWVMGEGVDVISGGVTGF